MSLPLVPTTRLKRSQARNFILLPRRGLASAAFSRGRRTRGESYEDSSDKRDGDGGGKVDAVTLERPALLAACILVMVSSAHAHTPPGASGPRPGRQRHALHPRMWRWDADHRMTDLDRSRAQVRVRRGREPLRLYWLFGPGGFNNQTAPTPRPGPVISRSDTQVHGAAVPGRNAGNQVFVDGGGTVSTVSMAATALASQETAYPVLYTATDLSTGCSESPSARGWRTRPINYGARRREPGKDQGRRCGGEAHAHRSLLTRRSCYRCSTARRRPPGPPGGSPRGSRRSARPAWTDPMPSMRGWQSLTRNTGCS